MHALLLRWLVFGVIGFWLMRAAWGLQFGCKPVRVGTIVCMAFFMWVPPVSIFATLQMIALWAIESSPLPESLPRPAFIEAWHKRRAARKIAKLNQRIARRSRGPSVISRLWNAELFDPCKWFVRHAEEDRVR